jgi:DNA-binding LacI/PurR family transcriptional regulator
VDRELPGVRCDFAGTDDTTGGRLAAEHLLKLGHRRLGHLAGPRSVSTARGRRSGFEDAVATWGRRASCRTVEGFHFSGLRQEALNLLHARPRPTAVFCVNDDAAADLYGAAAELGLNIPRDLSVVGFADLPVASWLRPALTTLRQDPYRLGREAVRIVLERRDGPPRKAGPIVVRLKPDLVVRKSTAAPLSEGGRKAP